MSRAIMSAGLASTLAVLLACAGCSTSTLVQSAEVLPLAQRVVTYHDEHVEEGPGSDEALAQSAALISALRAEEVSQPFLRGVLDPVLERYEKQIEADAGLSELERRIKTDDLRILRRVAGVESGD